MNSLWVVVIGGVIIFLAYNLYAKRIDRKVIEADPNRMTPAKMYMDGADFVPTSRFVLYGYHFKSIAAAGPIVGVITAANLWGWVPSIIWLMVGVSFIGWASDYSAIMVAVRNEGNSLSAIAHRLIAPRTRTILFLFIFFYLLLVAGAFVGIMAAVLDARPDVPFGVVMLAAMGLLAGYLIYRKRVDLVRTSLLVVGVSLLAMTLGPLGVTFQTGQPPTWDEGPISGVVQSVNNAVNGETPMYRVVDPTNADPRIPPPDPTTGERPTTRNFDAETGEIKVFPSFLLWAIFLLVFSYLGANLAIWRFAQPVNYIGFWVTALTIGLSAIGAVLAPFDIVEGVTGEFQIDGFKAFAPQQATAAIQPLWPMLFVTIACGAISGWHALFGSVGTARQLEYETDALPVGGGGMFSENTLGLLSLTAVAITAGTPGATGFASGVGQLLHVVTGGALGLAYGTALGLGAFVVIVLTVVQLVFRVMRVTLGEWLGDTWVGFKNPHVATIIGSLLVLFLVLSGTWVYLFQLFGASNQLMAALSLLIVTVWLASTRRNPAYAGIPMLFMYVTTIAASLVTAWNLFKTIATAEGMQVISVAGAWVMIFIALLLVVAAGVIGYDGWRAWERYRRAPAMEVPHPAPTSM